MKFKFKNLSCPRRFRFLVSSALKPYNAGSYWNNLISERLIRGADEITVSSRFLQNKFGGTIIWHGRNTNVLNPGKYRKKLAREKYGIRSNAKVVMFFGSPRPHKGIEDLIGSIQLINDKNIILMIVGVDRDRYCQSLVAMGKSKLGERFITMDLQPFSKIPEILTIADVVAIPTRKNTATMGQVPAKIFDAMAMAKTIIASDVGDVPEIVNNCGWIVRPGDPQALGETIKYVLENKKEAREKSLRARQKCINKYSWEAISKELLMVFKKYER